MKSALRKSVLTLHTWTGLVAGIVLLTVALSGALLVFRPLLERQFDAARFVVPAGMTRLPIDDLVARAQAAHPEGAVESVRYYGDPTMPLLVLFSTKEYVHLNPYTGAVLGVRKRYGEGFGWIEGLHKYLTLEPSTGEIVNGTFAFVIAGMVIAGVVLWWPATRRALVAGLTLNRRLSGRAWNLSLHRVLGAYAALILLFSALTGIPIALDSTRAVLNALTFSSRQVPPPPGPTTDAAFVGFEPLARRIEALMPHARETYISRPKRGLVSSYAIAADAPHPNARSYVWFTPEAGEIIRYAPYAQAPRGYRLYFWLLSLHTTMAGGWPMRLLLLFGTLSVPVLTYTGVMSYVRRKSRRVVPAPGGRPADSDPATQSAAAT